MTTGWLTRNAQRRKRDHVYRHTPSSLFITKGISIAYDSYSNIYAESYAGQRPKADQWVGNYGASSSTVTPTVDKIYYVPILIAYPIILQSIGVYVTTMDDGKQMVLGIYPFERGIIRDKILATNPIPLHGVGYRAQSIFFGLGPGAFMLAYNSNSSSVDIRAATVNVPILAISDPNETVDNTHYIEDQTYDGTLPDTPNATLASGTIPRIFVRMQ